jgi:hypothetical protein
MPMLSMEELWAPPTAEERAEIAAHISNEDFERDCPRPRKPVGGEKPVSAAAEWAARLKEKRKESAEFVAAATRRWEENGGAGDGGQDAEDIPLTQAEQEQQEQQRASAHAAKLAAYQELLDMFEDLTAGQRRIAQEHGARARKIEAARVKTLQVEQNFPRAEAFDPAKSTGWTSTTIAERSFITMLATELHLSEHAAGILINTNRTLHTYFEPTLQKLEAGEMSYRHVEIVVKESSPLKGQDEFTAYETELLPYAETLTPPQFARKARAIATRHARDDTDVTEERHRTAIIHREFTITPDEDGMANLHLYIDAVAATAIYNRATDAGKQLKSKEDERTLTQRRTDAATELLLTGTTHTPGTPTVDALNGRTMVRFVTTDDLAITGTAGSEPALGHAVIGTGLGAGISAQVSVHVPALTLLGHGTEEAYLDQYGPINLETAKLLMGSVSTFTRVLTEPDSGAILSVGKTRYTVPAAMRLWLHFRDGTCRFPGCTQPARACETDHVTDWQYGGETTVTNLASLCSAHHNIKHHTDWSYLLRPNGTAIWISPAGRRQTTDPAHTIPTE